MVKSAGRNRLVGYLQSEYHISQRRACRLLPSSRKALWYRPVRSERDADVIKRLKQLAEQYPRYGYLMLLSCCAARVWSRTASERIAFTASWVCRSEPSVGSPCLGLEYRWKSQLSPISDGLWILCTISWRLAGEGASSTWLMTTCEFALAS